MSSNLEKFQKNIIGSKNKISDYIPVISARGDFERVSDLSAIIKSWNNILITPVRTASHDPEYGSTLYDFLYEPVDTHTQKAIEEEVRYRLLTYDNRARIISVTVSFLKSGKGFNVAIKANYNGEEGELGVTINEANRLGFLGG